MTTNTQTNRLDWRVMAPIFAVTAVDAIGMGVVMPLLPFYAAEFGASAIQVGLIFSAFALAQFFGAPMLGKLSDKYGRRNVLMVSQVVSILGLSLLASASALWIVFAARIIAGFAAGNMSVAVATAADVSAPENRKQAIGIVSAAMGVGLVIGPALPAFIPIQAISAPIWLAAGLGVIALALTAIWFPNITPSGQGKPKGKGGFAAALENKQILMILAALACFYLVFGMYVPQFPLFAEARYAWQGMPVGPKQIAWAFTAAGSVNIFMQLFALGRLSRIFSDKGLILLSHLLLLGGYCTFAATTHIFGLGVGVVAIAMGSAITRPTLAAAMSVRADPGRQGTLMGINMSLSAICSVIAPPLAGILIAGDMLIGWALLAAGIITIGLVIGQFALSLKSPSAADTRPTAS